MHVTSFSRMVELLRYFRTRRRRDHRQAADPLIGRSRSISRAAFPVSVNNGKAELPVDPPRPVFRLFDTCSGRGSETGHSPLCKQSSAGIESIANPDGRAGSEGGRPVTVESS
jgi:hypothetical protein